jgi:ATP-dependent helicase/nuclease subunit A
VREIAAAKLEEYGVSREQFDCLDLGRNIAVTAGAGSGKTRVLTRRYLRLLKEAPDASIDNIVAITFTEKAALEMRERVRRLIDAERERTTDPARKRHWQSLREKMPAANICTIHSWCAAILRESFVPLGLDPAFGIIEEAGQKTTLLRLAQETVAASLGRTEDDAAVEAMLDFHGSDYFRHDDLAGELINLYLKIREAGMTIAAVRGMTDPSARAAALGAADLTAPPELLPCLSEVELYALRRLAELDDRYTAYKRQEGVLDFNDLEVLALQALSRPDIRDAYRARWRHYLIDEFQDTNDLQRRLIYALLHDGGSLPKQGLFIVGDRQQAIYGFRGTDYRVFSQVSADIGLDGCRVLSQCYRSSPSIINTVNKLFGQLLASYQPLAVAPGREMAAGKKVEIITLASEKKASDTAWKELQKVIRNGGTEEELRGAFAGLEAASAAAATADREAEALAGRIRRLAEDGYRYGEIAVLLRSRTRLPEYEHSLRRHGIPYCVLGGLGFFERQEVRDIINTYKILFNPADRVALVGALRSPLFALSDAAVADLFSFLPEHPADLGLALRLTAAAAPVAAAAALRAEKIITELTAAAGRHGAGEFLEMILAATRGREIFLTQLDGAQRCRNLEKLASIAGEFDAKQLYSPRQFPAYLENLAAAAGREGEAALDTEDSDAVKLMTIHAAKGLEFKAVFIPDAGKDLLRKAARSRPNLVFSRRYGVIARGGDVTGPNPLYESHYRQVCDEELAEARRLLYVAATRAKEFLAIIGEDKGSPDKDNLNSFMKMLKYALNECGGSLDTLEIIDGSSLLPGDPPEIQPFEQRKAEIAAYDFAALTGTADADERIYWEYGGPVGIQVSVSQYLNYQSCPRYYYLRYRSGPGELCRFPAAGTAGEEREETSQAEQEYCEPAAPKVHLTAAARGSLVHRLLERMAAGRLAAENVASLIEAELRVAAPGLSDAAAAERREEITRYLINCRRLDEELARRQTGRLVRRATELPFLIPLEPEQELVLSGVIDRLDIYERDGSYEAVLIDYKTDRRKSAAELEARYRPQLLVYGEAVRRLCRHRGRILSPGSICLYLLDSGECRTLAWEAAAAGALLDDMRRVFGFIGRHAGLDDYAPVPGERCRNCEYRELCAALGAARAGAQ